MKKQISLQAKKKQSVEKLKAAASVTLMAEVSNHVKPQFLYSFDVHYPRFSGNVQYWLTRLAHHVTTDPKWRGTLIRVAIFNTSTEKSLTQGNKIAQYQNGEWCWTHPDYILSTPQK